MKTKPGNSINGKIKQEPVSTAAPPPPTSTATDAQTAAVEPPEGPCFPRQDLRVAVVQLHCHPYLTVGAREFFSEPFISEKEPCLARIASTSRDFPVQDIQYQNKKEYREWHRQRLNAVEEWLRNLKNEKHLGERMADLVVFSEGAIGRVFLKDLADFARETKTVIVAGTHAFQATDEAFEDYVNLNVHEHDEFYDDFWQEKGAELRRKPRAAGVAATDESKVENSARHVYKQEFRMWEFERHSNLTLPTRSILTIIDSDGSVRFRAKSALSPFEETSNDVVDMKQAALHNPRTYMVKLRDGRVLKIFPLVCSEALQSLTVPAEAELLVICSYDKQTENFDHLINHVAYNKVPVVYCNDGRYGGSSIAVNYDNRGEQWWMHEPNHARMKKGDGILVMDIMPGATEVGTSRPSRRSRFVALPAVVPENARVSESRVARLLQSIWPPMGVPPHVARPTGIPQKNEANVDRSVSRGYHREDLVRQLTDLREREEPTAIQAAKIDRLIQLAKNGQLSELRWKALGCDCFVRGGHAADQAPISVRGGQVRSLKQLEQHMTRRCYAFVRHLLESPALDERASRMLIQVRDECLAKIRIRRDATVTLATASLLRDFKNASNAAAKQRLRHLLGTLVERFEGTSGYVFLKQEKMFPAQVGKKSPPSAGQAGAMQSELSLITTHNVPSSYKKREIDLKVEQSEKGIVRKVADLGTGILANDVSKHPDYESAVGTTRAEIAVPVFFPAAVDVESGAEVPERKVLGVVNIEVNEEHKFLALHLADLENAAAALVPDLLILHQQRKGKWFSGWHPEVHGWGYEKLLTEFCECVAHTPENAEASHRFSCTLWHADREKHVLYVLATARFDYEYISRYVLPHDPPPEGGQRQATPRSHPNSFVHNKRSFTGQVARLERSDSPQRQHMERIPEFSRKAKAQRMEVMQVVSGAVFPPPETSHKALGVLNLYFFKHEESLSGEDVEQIFSDYIVKRLCEQAGNVLHDSARLRDRVATAYLTARLADATHPQLTMFHVMRMVLIEVLRAQSCSILIRLPADSDGRPRLLTVSSSVSCRAGRTGSDPPFMGYPVVTLPKLPSGGESEEDQGFRMYKGITRYLLNNAGITLRKLDALDRFEVCDGGICVVPETRLFDETISGPGEASRFLGCSVESLRHSKTTAAVIRLTRGAGQAPFVASDARLLEFLSLICRELCTEAAKQLEIQMGGMGARLPLLMPCLQQRQEPWEDVTKGPILEDSRAIMRLFSVPRVAPFWNEGLITSLLQDVVWLLRARQSWQDEKRLVEAVGDFFLASVRFVMEDARQERLLKLFSFYGLGTRQPPDEQFHHPMRCKLGSIGWAAIDLRRPIVFRRPNNFFRMIHVHSEHVEAGLCMPFTVATNERILTGVLSLDCEEVEEEHWENALEVAFRAVRKLGCLSWGAHESDPLFTSEDDPADLTSVAALMDWYEKSISVVVAEFDNRVASGKEESKPSGLQDFRLIRHCTDDFLRRDSSEKDPEVVADLKLYGYGYDLRTKILTVPLRLAIFPVAALQVKMKSEEVTLEAALLIARLLAVWTRAITCTKGIGDFWRVTFQEGETFAKNVVIWEHIIKEVPLNPSRPAAVKSAKKPTKSPTRRNRQTSSKPRRKSAR